MPVIGVEFGYYNISSCDRPSRLSISVLSHTQEKATFSMGRLVWSSQHNWGRVGTGESRILHEWDRVCTEEGCILRGQDGTEL